MKIGVKLNLWSMILMLFCWVAIFIPLPSIPFNRHYAILSTSIIVFFLSVMGLGGIKSWRTVAQSTIAIIGSFVLVLFESWVVFVGSLLS